MRNDSWLAPLLLCACSSGLLSCNSSPSLSPGIHAEPLARPEPVASEYQTPSSTIAVVIGQRTVDDLDFSSLDPGLDVSDQNGFGIEYASIGASGLGFETGIFYGSGDATGATVTVDSSVLEVAFGGRYTYRELGRFLPYVAAGGELVTVSGDVSGNGTTVLVEDTDFGGYVHGGIAYVVGGGFFLGLDLRALFGTEEQDYSQIAGTIGFAF